MTRIYFLLTYQYVMRLTNNENEESHQYVDSFLTCNESELILSSLN